MDRSVWWAIGGAEELLAVIQFQGFPPTPCRPHCKRKLSGHQKAAPATEERYRPCEALLLRVVPALPPNHWFRSRDDKRPRNCAAAPNGRLGHCDRPARSLPRPAGSRGCTARDEHFGSDQKLVRQYDSQALQAEHWPSEA